MREREREKQKERRKSKKKRVRRTTSARRKKSLKRKEKEEGETSGDHRIPQKNEDTSDYKHSRAWSSLGEKLPATTHSRGP